MPDAIFAHPRLARIYDAFDGERDDLAAYLALADELGAERVLDVGCGTGCLAVLLADSGREVVGVDPAEASLAIARAKDPAGRIRWVHADATGVPAVDADLAVLTGTWHRSSSPTTSGTVPCEGFTRHCALAATSCSRPGGRHAGPGRTGLPTPLR
jgi:SAM-dependent methyltransferase